jgi:hypothetical protein
MLLWFLAAYAGAVLLAAMLIVALRRRSRAKAWADWHRGQRGLTWAWLRLFGRSHVKRLTHAPAPGEQGRG